MIEGHNCVDNMECDDMEFDGELMYYYGECGVCGRKLVETYALRDIRDADTDVILKEFD